MYTPTPDDAVRARADLITALAFVALGLMVVYLSWTMPRLEARRIHPATIPGLVPLILGSALTLCGGLLAYRSARLGQPGAWAGLWARLTSWGYVRVTVILVLSLIHTLVLLGNMPFWLASALFIFAFIMLFETVLAEERRPLLSSLLWALGIAVAGSGAIFYVFERIFLVRLP